MEYLVAVVVCAVVFGYWISRKRNKKPPQDTYVCDICGEKECLCHKEEKGG
jgi:hypothetical protein